MTENRGVMSSITFVSNSVVLANSSRTSIQGIGIAATTPTILLSSVFYLPCFPFKPTSISMINEVLNYIVLFFPAHCVFQ